MVYRLHQHNIYVIWETVLQLQSKDPTNSFKVMKEKTLLKYNKPRKANNTKYSNDTQKTVP